MKTLDGFADSFADSLARAARPLAAGAIFTVAVGAALAAGAAPAQADNDLVIRDFILTNGIAEREPVDAVESFAGIDDQAFAFVRVANDGPATALTMVWRHEGRVHAELDLSIGTSNGWRTWSSANLKAGQWRVELVDPAGVVLAQRNFAVGSEMALDVSPTPAMREEMRGGAKFEQLSQDPAWRALPDRHPGLAPSASGSDG